MPECAINGEPPFLQETGRSRHDLRLKVIYFRIFDRDSLQFYWGIKEGLHPLQSIRPIRRSASTNRTTMKPSTLFSPLALFPTLISALSVSYDTAYDNPMGSLSTVACSDGSNGMLTRGFTNFDSLPKFPHIGGAPEITGWNSSNCGTCWSLTYTNPQKVSKSVNILAIDVSTPDFTIALSAMDELTGGQAQNLGKVTITAAQVASSVCGL